MTRHYLFHITPLQRIANIISSGALHCAASLAKQQAKDHPSWWNSAHWKRRQHRVPCPPEGTLLESVHLYFFKHPPQLHRTPEHPSTQWAYLVTDVATLRDANCRLAFSDGDPMVTALTQFYPSGHRFDVLDWTLHQHTEWRATQEHLDRDRQRGATMLVKHKLPLDLILGITVASPEAEHLVRQHLREHKRENLDVIIRPEWF